MALDQIVANPESEDLFSVELLYFEVVRLPLHVMLPYESTLVVQYCNRRMRYSITSRSYEDMVVIVALGRVCGLPQHWRYQIY